MKKRINLDIKEELDLDFADWLPPRQQRIVLDQATAADKKARLEDLNSRHAGCVRCALGRTRTKFVFGEGAPSSSLMFIGEGPGFDEDHTGRPFVGRAGQLLTDIIEKGMKLKRSDVYIANVVKCHPMKNPLVPHARSNDRPPTPEEMAACCDIIEEQIKIVAPAVIVALGGTAAQFLLKTGEGISKLRGRWFKRGGIKVMCVFHPSYLLRNASREKGGPRDLMWQDIKMVMRELESLSA